MLLRTTVLKRTTISVRLKDVKDLENEDPSGRPIKARMQELCEGVGKDIQDCSNVCDTFSKEKLVVKVLKGPIWEGRLTRYVGLFSQRRDQFQFAMTMHTTLGVDNIDRRLQEMQNKAEERFVP